MRTAWSIAGVRAIFLAAPLVFAVACQSAQSAWVPVGRDDLAGTPDLSQRNTSTLDLETTGDFNGDGRPDRAFIARDSQRGKYGVVLCLAKAEGNCVEELVTSGPYNDVKNLGVGKMSRADIRSSLSGKRADALETIDRSPATELLHVFAFEASSAVYVWTGSSFTRVQVTD